MSSVNPRNVTEGRDRSIVVQNVLRDLPITIVVAKPETAALREWKSIALLQANEAIVFSAIILIAISIVYRILRMQERLIAELADAREQAQAASSYKSTFLANMSHELRTPLNAIIGFSEIINKEILGKISQPKYVEYSSDIHSAGSHLLELINEILDFSKIESGKLELSESVVDLHHVIERSIRLLRERADSKDVKITYHEPREVIAIKCDELRMRQVLLNLMANAIKFTPNGGTVSIDVDATVNGISVAISDTGVGMTEEEVAQALQPFVQIKRLSLSKGEGTGLGLPIAIRLVELHGGLLKIQSKLAVGTTAQIRLPKWRVVGSAE